MKKGDKMTEEQKADFKKRIADGRAAAKAKREAAESGETVIIADTNIEAAKKGTPAVHVKDDNDIQFFTEADYNDKGKIAVDLPAWYFDKNIQELEENINTLTRQINDGVYTGTKKRDAERRLNLCQGKLDKINEGTPQLKGQIKDKVASSCKELGDRIADSWFSYDSHWKQTADPHEVAKRINTPCIEIKDQAVYSFAKQRGMEIKNGKISQNNANLVWKSMRKLLGDSTDSSILQPVK